MNHLDFLNLLKERNYGDFANSNYPMKVGFNFEKPNSHLRIYTLKYKLNYPTTRFYRRGFRNYYYEVSFEEFFEEIKCPELKKLFCFNLDILKF